MEVFNMKIWTNVLLASSLLFTTLGATTITNEVSAKENVKATTSAAAKKAIYQGFKGGESRATIKKIAKKKGWKLKDEQEFNITYSKVNLYGQKNWTVTFVFDSPYSDDMFTDMYYEAPVQKGKKSKAAVKKEQTKLHNQIKKDLGNKKPLYASSPSVDEGTVKYASKWDMWDMKDVTVYSLTSYKSKKTEQVIIVSFYFDL